LFVLITTSTFCQQQQQGSLLSGMDGALPRVLVELPRVRIYRLGLCDRPPLHPSTQQITR
ncbi:MAG: hypothetical protein VKJ64_17850, partial [Leptolyngbyaceae bacterium]|nr:hypothetical protein [Leptolyngbyaceae bacterium]